MTEQMQPDRSARQARILDLLAGHGQLSVRALARELHVSEVTIRTDLTDMEERGLLSRTRGGAEAAGTRSVLQRRGQFADEKNRIAKAAAGLVRDNDLIMVEAGTTTALVVRHLVGRRGVQIVTNSLLVLNYARRLPGLNVMLTGGTFDPASESLVGPVAARSLAEFNVRLAFVGTDGFTIEHGMTTGYPEGGEVIRAMSSRAQETWLLADSSKYGHAGFVGVMPLSALTGLITDDGLAKEAVEALDEAVPSLRLLQENQSR